MSTIIVFFTLNIANNMLLESALSFLGAGVRPPNASWGTMIADGYQMIYTAPHLTVVPGLMIVMTVLSLNVFGDGLRDALDPKAEDQAGTLMTRFIAKRLIGMVAVLFAISVIVFLIFNVIPNSDPAARIAGKNADPAADRAGQRRPRARPAATGAVRDDDEGDLHRSADLLCQRSQCGANRSGRGCPPRSRCASAPR